MVRYVVFGLFCLSIVVALAAWLVRSRRVSPFSSLARGLRSFSDPVLRPIERRLVASGANPVHAA
jgi:YggT family protein